MPNPRAPGRRPHSRWENASRLLCVCGDSLGSLSGVLMCTPAMRALQIAVPGRSLSLLSTASACAALPFVPELDAAIALDSPSLRANLAAGRFDAAVIFTSHHDDAMPAAMLCREAGIALRLAYCHAPPGPLLSDWVLDPEPVSRTRHEVQRQLALVALVTTAGAPGAAAKAPPRLSFAPRAQDVVAVRSRLGSAGIDPDARWLLLHPGADIAAHRYPPGHWASALRLLHEALGIPLVLAGGAGDAALVEAIRAAAGVPALVLCGGLPSGLTLGELGAAIALAAVVVSGNGGPVHIAAAVGTPLVNLYALTTPQHTPWHVPNRVLFHDVCCRFCRHSTCPVEDHACLSGVAPERVLDAVRALLARTTV